MKQFENGVPFDPGYSTIACSFIDNISCITSEFTQLKELHKKKFKLKLIEPSIIELINKCSAFYLGCILWGAYIHYRFKDSPKEILGNNTKDLTSEEIKELDCAEETKFMLEYITQLDRDCKYFLRKPASVPEFIITILKNYNEFAALNKNFIHVNKTDDIKIPADFKYFSDMTDKQLDDLCLKIFEIIESKNIEKILEIGLIDKNY